MKSAFLLFFHFFFLTKKNETKKSQDCLKILTPFSTKKTTQKKLARVLLNDILVC